MAVNIVRYNGWIPSPAVYEAFVNDIVERAAVRHRTDSDHVPAVKTFKEEIEADPIMVELFTKIFLQATTSKVHNFEHLLHLFDLIVVAPPKFVQATDHGVNEPIGVPMYLVFDLLSNTAAAYDLFRMKSFNEALKNLLCSWGEYLKTSDSSKTLTDAADGWFSETAIKSLDNGRGTFNETYVVSDEDAVNRGYVSWDEFFTRRVRAKARPIIPAPEGKTVIYNACESTVERHVSNVKAHDQFWLKGSMPYSLYDIFDGDNDTAQNFVGGTIYQAFLSPQDYHRWHSPVAGTVVQARIVPGTYYAVLPDEGDQGSQAGALIRSQPWLTVAATRAIITIQADDPKLGLVGFIGIGMAEVSTCELTVQAGNRVKPGQQIGLFHFGGSSHALIFGPSTPVTFSDDVKPNTHIKVNTIIAAVE